MNEGGSSAISRLRTIELQFEKGLPLEATHFFDERSKSDFRE
jgi:hypothetical protein